MTPLQRFLNREVAIFIPSNYDEGDISWLQALLDIANGEDVRFSQAGTILDWCTKKGRDHLNVCIAYDTDKRLVWCDVGWYASRGYEIITVDMALNGCVQNFSEEDFDSALEMG